MASSVVVVTLGARGVGEYLNKRTNGTLGLIVRSDAPSSVLSRDLAMLTLNVLENQTLREYVGIQARKFVVASFSAEKMAQKYLSLYLDVVAATSWKRWRLRSIPSTLERAIFEMSRSEVNKLSFDVKEAEREMKRVVSDSNTMDASFANLMRGAVLGVTRFPLIAHLQHKKIIEKYCQI